MAAPHSTKIDSHAQYISTGIPSSSSLLPDPTAQFNLWFQSALQNPAVHEPEAMAVSTVSDKGIPSTRVVLCKRVDERGWTFFTNYESRKGKELFPPADADGKGGYASIAFYWPATHQQIRIVGRAEKLSEEETKEYYDGRPIGSRLGAWASPQSTVLGSREELDGLVKKVEEKFGVSSEGKASAVDVGPTSTSSDATATATEKEIPVPPFWGGVRIVPFEVEFWMGRESRLHDRFRYTRPEGDTGKEWEVVRLAP